MDSYFVLMSSLQVSNERVNTKFPIFIYSEWYHINYQPMFHYVMPPI